MKINPWDTLLKQKRLREGYSLRDLGRVLSEPFALLQKIESRVKPAPYRTIVKLSEHFFSMPEDIFDSKGFAMKICDIEEDERQMNLAFGGAS